MKKVLLADDERSSSDIIKFFIEKHTLPLEVVAETVRGDETVDAIKRLRPDIVFLDIEMPGLNGIEVMEKIRNEYAGNVAFIIITAYNSFEYIQRALRLNAKDFLLKPILYEQFCETLQNVLGYRYSESSLFNQILEYISNHYTEEISLDSCAKATLSSKSHISHLISANLNTNFTAYYNSLRIEKAKELLAKGHPIKEVCNNVGYNNMNYFYKIFKDRVGMTPKEYCTNHVRAQAPN